MALRSLAHAAEVLTKRHEQEEVLQIFDKINKETGWRIGFVYKDLKEKWGWNEEPSAHQFAQTHTAAKQQKEREEAQQRQLQEQAAAAMQQQSYDFHQQQRLNLPMPQHPPPQSLGPPPPPVSMNSTPSGSSGSGGSGGQGGGGAAAPRKMPQGIPNPMYAKADFNLPQHPYQNFYVAPNHVSGSTWQSLGLGLGGGGGQGFYNLT